MNPDHETNISIRCTKRFRAWFAIRSQQENYTASSMGMALLNDWIERGSPMLTPGMTREPILWNEAIAWETMDPKVAAKEIKGSQPSRSFIKRQ